MTPNENWKMSQGHKTNNATMILNARTEETEKVGAREGKKQRTEQRRERSDLGGGAGR